MRLVKSMKRPPKPSSLLLAGHAEETWFEPKLGVGLRSSWAPPPMVTPILRMSPRARRGKRMHGGGEHGLFDRAQRALVLAAEWAEQVDRRGGHGILGCGGVDNSDARGVTAAEAATIDRPASSMPDLTLSMAPPPSHGITAPEM